LRARTVMPLVRRSYDVEIGSVDFGDSMQTVSDDFFLCSELGLIIHLLKITAAASPKIGTWRFDSMRRWFDDLFDRSERDAALHSFDADAQAIAGRSERHHHRLAVGVRQAEPARQDAFDCDFHLVSEADREGGPDKTSALRNGRASETTLSGVQEKEAQARHAKMFAQPFLQKVLARLREHFFVHVTLVRFNLRIDF
jgi:hypothetical protein